MPGVRHRGADADEECRVEIAWCCTSVWGSVNKDADANEDQEHKRSFDDSVQRERSLEDAEVMFSEGDTPSPKATWRWTDDCRSW